MGAVVDGRAGIAIEERPGDKTAGNKFLQKMFLQAKKVRDEENAMLHNGKLSYQK